MTIEWHKYLYKMASRKATGKEKENIGDDASNMVTQHIIPITPEFAKTALADSVPLAKNPLNTWVNVENRMPIHPTTKIQLNVEEIPPIEIFYNPQHKVVIKKIRKKRMAKSEESPSNSFSLEVVWRRCYIAPHQEF